MTRIEHLLVGVSIVLSLIHLCLGFLGSTSRYNVHQEPPYEMNDFKSALALTVDKHFISQKVDHFNAQNLRTWKMQYMENKRFFTDGGPLFIFVGGEWEITEGWLLVGHMYDMAKEFNGSLFYSEHRYYGKSHPTDDTSTENLEFLSVHQALADLAHLIVHIKSSDEYKNSKVILVGASYSATMVVWFRLKYPHLINGGWASSAPLVAKMNYEEYNEIMTDSYLEIGGQECVNLFEKAIVRLEEIVLSGNTSRIEKEFDLCEPLQPNDIETLFYEIDNAFAASVQGYTPTNQFIEKDCKFILNDKYTDEVEALGAWMRKGEKKCLDMSYQNSIEIFQNITWGSTANEQLRQWTYQTCSEFGWYATVTSKKQIFGTMYPTLDYFINVCNDLFDNIFDKETIEENTRNTNINYGGINNEITNLYSTHGKLDPWHPLGILKSNNKLSFATVIPGYSHCPDLLSVSSKDSDEMNASKMKILELVRSWII
ncbi:unnamed protein product [Diamesa serratosioi]